MHGSSEGLMHNPIMRAAMVAPVVIMFLFSFFSLSAPLDAQKAMAGLSIGIVNLDTGMGPLKLSDRMMEGMGERLPFGVTPYESAEAGRAALEAGEVAALITVPADFSSAATSGGTITIVVMATQHLTPVEAQLGVMLGQQLQAGAASAMAQSPLPIKPTLAVTTEYLHEAPNQSALLSPAIATFAIWVGSLAGGVMLFLATEQAKATLGASRVIGMRAAVPLVVSGLAGLVLGLVIAWLGESWGAFVPLWLVLWAGIYAVSMLVAGLLAVFKLWALIVILPLVFYQNLLAGGQAPVNAAPDWLRWFGEALPFHALPDAVRSVLIGGPDGGFWPAVGWAALFGVVLIVAGTYVWSAVKRNTVASQHG
jgi:uncharacterized phage infection (PIP) family protein YhgE